MDDLVTATALAKMIRIKVGTSVRSPRRPMRDETASGLDCKERGCRSDHLCDRVTDHFGHPAAVHEAA
jgi:hypothetical protein